MFVIIGYCDKKLNKQKKHLERRFLTNGARYYANIGLRIMRNLRGFAGKWTTLYDDRLIWRISVSFYLF